MGQNNLIDKVALIYIENRRILMALSKGNEVYYIPGGKRESGESDKQALSREIKEELSADIIPESIEYYGTFEAQAHGKSPGVIVKMTCYIAGLGGEIKPGAEIEDVAYYSYAQRGIVGPVDQLIFDDLRSKNLID
jgi:8-oxo-dGTP diphosphatase